MTTCQYLDALKKRYGLPSDYALAKKLGITRARLSRYRTKKDFFGDETALLVADLLDIPAPVVLANIHAERAKDPAVKRAWKAAIKQLSVAASVCFVAILLAGPGHVDATPNSNFLQSNNIYYAQLNC